MSIEGAGQGVMAFVEVAYRDIVRQLDFAAQDSSDIAWPAPMTCLRTPVAVPLIEVPCLQLVESVRVCCLRVSLSETRRRHRFRCRSLVRVRSSMPVMH